MEIHRARLRRDYLRTNCVPVDLATTGVQSESMLGTRRVTLAFASLAWNGTRVRCGSACQAILASRFRVGTRRRIVVSLFPSVAPLFSRGCSNFVSGLAGAASGCDSSSSVTDLVGAFFFKMVDSSFVGAGRFTSISLPASSLTRVPRERVPVPSPSVLVAPAGVAPRSGSWKVRGVGAGSLGGSAGFFQAALPLVAGAVVVGAGDDGEQPLRQPPLVAGACEAVPHGPHDGATATGPQP